MAVLTIGLTVWVTGCPDAGTDPMATPQGSTTSQASTAGTGSASTSLQTTGTTMQPADSTGGTTDPGPATIAVEESGSPPEYCPPGVEPTLTVGHGVEEFMPPEAGPAQVYLGHQGGYHITLGMRGTGLDLSDWGDGQVRGTVDGTVVADHPTIIAMSCDEGGEYSEALWINLIFEEPPQALLGQAIFVEAEYVDASNTMVAGTAELTISDTIIPL